MREIKFRAWDKFNAEMLTVDVLQLIDPDGEPWIGFVTEKGGNGVVPLRLVELMQFTGLLDKKGAEIYEGDIIRCSAVQREINEVLESETVVVSYMSGYFYPFGYNAGWRSEVYDIELLGNIYQNPEQVK